MTGSLDTVVDIVFRYDVARQRTVLARRQAGGLCHLSKPYWNGEVLGLQVVNPTAGFFAGDSLSVNVLVMDGAQAALTSPSATRYYSMPTGQAVISQEFTLGVGAWLDFWPEMVVPQRNSEVSQTTEIILSKNSQMVFLDLLAPGRIAYGEHLAFRRLETRLAIERDGQLLAKERCLIEPAKDTWPLAVPRWNVCYYGALWIAGHRTPEAIRAVASEVFDCDVMQCGASLVSDDLGVIRVIASSSVVLKKGLSRLRTILQSYFPLLSMHFRKL